MVLTSSILSKCFIVKLFNKSLLLRIVNKFPCLNQLKAMVALVGGMVTWIKQSELAPWQGTSH